MSPPDRCPGCSCDLSARPPPNVCPDCGFRYDEHTRVWVSGESWAHIAGVYTAFGLLVGLFVAAVYRVGFERSPYPALPLLLGLITPAVGLLFRKVISGRITGRFVALTPAGVLVGTRVPPTLIPWADVDRVVEHRGVPRLQRRSGPPAVPLDDIFPGPTEIAVFRAELDAARCRYRTDPNDGLRHECPSG